MKEMTQRVQGELFIGMQGKYLFSCRDSLLFSREDLEDIFCIFHYGTYKYKFSQNLDSNKLLKT